MRGGRKQEKLLMDCVTENKESIYRLAYSYVKNKDDALDIVQDAIHKAFLSINKLQNKGSIKSWFYRIVVTTSLDFLRKHKHMHVMEDEILESFIPGQHDAYTNLDLAESIDDLPEKYRTVIILRFFEDMKIEDIAKVTQENVNTVKTRLYQALKQLRISLDEEQLKEVHHR
ncbi:RNA polymerase sigma factor [Paenibacillus faecalis]|uniref:RNA polymerase sigma factor n=1 Tax=Paenibacillus faecalis TaxID=2079532 RepID=UPI000D101A1E|nr:RNA polymerase sigma factor [Paenibacillus faecalis]